MNPVRLNLRQRQTPKGRLQTLSRIIENQPHMCRPRRTRHLLHLSLRLLRLPAALASKPLMLNQAIWKATDGYRMRVETQVMLSYRSALVPQNRLAVDTAASRAITLHSQSAPQAKLMARECLR
jgi:hypothetical protein